jgi:hypothetical protein
MKKYYNKTFLMELRYSNIIKTSIKSEIIEKISLKRKNNKSTSMTPKNIFDYKQ